MTAPYSGDPGRFRPPLDNIADGGIAGLRRAVLAASTVLVPVSCAGCGIDDVSLCPECRSRCAPSIRRETVHGVPVVSSLDYAGAVARILVSFKNRGRTGLGRALGPAFGASVRALAGADAGSGWDDVLILAVPGRREAMRRRGYRPVVILARHAGVPLDRGLRLTRQPLDQLGLGRRDRDENLRLAMSADARITGCRVVVVDDVLTTGATIREAARAVDAAGGVLVGAAVLARTPPGRRIRASADDRLGVPSESS